MRLLSHTSDVSNEAAWLPGEPVAPRSGSLASVVFHVLDVSFPALFSSLHVVTENGDLKFRLAQGRSGASSITIEDEGTLLREQYHDTACPQRPF